MTTNRRFGASGRLCLKSLLAVSTILAAGIATLPAYGQSAQFRNLDENGVDLVIGDYVMAFKEGSIGSGAAELILIRDGAGGMDSQWDGYTFALTNSGGAVTIRIGRPDQSTEFFTGGTLSVTPSIPNGASLTRDTSTQSWVYRTSDGTAVSFLDPNYDAGGTPGFCTWFSPTTGCILVAVSKQSPNGQTDYINWDVPSDGSTPKIYSVYNGVGYAITFAYSGYNRTSATFSRDGTTQGTVTYAYPSAGVVDVTDMAGNVWRITATSITRPGESSPNFSVSGTTGVTSVTRDGITTGYNRGVVGTTITMTKTDALNNATVIVSDSTVGRPGTITDPLGSVTTFAYDSTKRLTRVTQDEGNYTELTLDSRGNVTTTTTVAKSGSGLANIVTSATYLSTCSDYVTCNQPTTTTDARGKVTNYTYDSTHGGVTAVTSPAPGGIGTRPETRYSYTFTGGGYRVTGVSACQTGASCTGTADEVVTAIAYDSYGNATSVTNKAGNNSLVATTAATYNALGDVLTVDGPLSGTDDTTTFRYDAARRQTGVISADPDGSGSLKRRAQKVTYDSAGRVTQVERGTVTGTDNTAWAAFAPAEKVVTTWSNGRKAKDVLASGSTDYAVTQYGYDAVGRSQCVAQRMKPASWASLPTNVCTVTTGTGDEDRIVKTSYDAAGRVNRTESAVDTAGQADEAVLTHSDNGQVATVTDGKGNKTTYEYDGYDRLKKTRYPSPTTAGTSSTTDYEELGYDAGSNVTSVRRRDGQTIDFAYDDLSRQTGKDMPSGHFDTIYSYDLLGRTLSAARTDGHTASFAYDALSRVISAGANTGTVAYQYDIAGRRTRVTHPGNTFYAQYDYLVTGEVSKVRENGATSGAGVLATFDYDDLGRRITLTRGNGALTSYNYDAVSRLASLGHDLTGTSADVTTTFTHNNASQIAGMTRTNDGYAFPGFANVNRTDTLNGLNQVTATGGTSVSRDARGNTTAIGSTTFSYDAENWMKHGAGLSQMYADPVGRLIRTIAGSTSQGYVWDGHDLISELNGTGQVVRRYVHGPGMDEPLVWYEGSGTSDRRWLHADERGSVVAVSDSTGASIATNSYDEYGLPASTNTGRFGYTGQLWLPDLGMYYYKARVYNPALGRFMQADPIGYGDGMNLYAYVKGDPMNLVDPMGMKSKEPPKLPQCSNGMSDANACEVPVTAPNGDSWYIPWGPGEGVRWYPTPESSFFDGDGSDEGLVVVTVKRQNACNFANNFCGPLPSPAPSPPPVRYDPTVNYCGQEGGARFPSGTWNKACYNHDICYGSKKSSKTSCDLIFSGDIKQQCQVEDPQDPVCSAASIIYFYSVLLGGHDAYKK